MREGGRGGEVRGRARRGGTHVDSNLGWAVTQSPRVKTTDETRLMRGRRGFRVKSRTAVSVEKSRTRGKTYLIRRAHDSTRLARCASALGGASEGVVAHSEFRRYVQG